MPKMIEHIHYYINDAGWVVLTEKYLLERGYCCGNGCLHCPYSYEQVAEPTRSELLKKRERGLTDRK
ncbi:MAG: DUF5522 domain-containing protein [Chitinophagaceae bacterium]